MHRDSTSPRFTRHPKNPLREISGYALFEEIKNHGYREAYYVENKENIPDALMDELKADDLLIFLGAGDVWRQGLKVLERLG